MKAVTEFPSYTLNQAVTAKGTLTAAGKTPEEIQTSLGESFKLEGDKLKHFIAAVDVAAQNAQNLRRVLVVSLAEGEKVPVKAVKVEEHHYIPEFLVLASAKPAESGDRKGGRRKDGKSGPKSSPWGLSPEEKAAKNKNVAGKTK